MVRILTIPALMFLVSSPSLAALTTTFQQTGNLGIEIAAAAGNNLPLTTVTLNINNIPPGAIIVRATVHASEINNPSGLNLTFAGNSVAPIGPPVSDAAFLTMYEYSYNVAPYVNPAPGSYTCSLGQVSPASNQIAVVALVVVWQHAIEPTRTITVIDGMKQVGESGPETESVVFGSLPGGPTTAWVVTSGDDNSNSGETVAYNGSTIGGPLDQVLGFSGSLLQMNTTSLVGNNTMAITTGLDHMGWMIAVTSVTPAVTPTRPMTWGRIRALYR